MSIRITTAQVPSMKLWIKKEKIKTKTNCLEEKTLEKSIRKEVVKKK